jgi:hypothetical protein
MIQPPEYFHTIAKNSKQRWDQLEGDPELAGPWRQLFSQVQSPRHVVSEMLQNADDAGATWVEVSERDNKFVFEHNGRDFTADEFASLCRFGYSNKRNLHTIGFRGIGFKSLFSLGPTVCLTTPTLSVRFQSKRFTEPSWHEPQHEYDRTRIEVEIHDSNRILELHKNFEQWISSPLSLLFFASVRKLTIQGRTIEKETLATGPSKNSAWVRLTGSSYERILHAWSREAPFPDDAINEIKQERNTDDLNLPPCRVEVVYSPAASARVFVVLPTGVSPTLPFSCHAPFLQDPARFGIKDPAISPTNRWLLDRVGTLAAEIMLDWLDNREFPDKGRAAAYKLLPPSRGSGDSVDASVTERVGKSFKGHCIGKPVILTDDAELAFPPNCLSIPRDISGVWSSKQVNLILGRNEMPHASPYIGDREERTLEAWNWLEVVEAIDLVEALRGEITVPRPKSFALIARLWSFVQKTSVRRYLAKWGQEVRMVPIEGAAELLAPCDVVRISERKTDLPDTEWTFLSSFVQVVDSDWLKLLREVKSNESVLDNNPPEFIEAAALLKEVGLESPTSTDRLVEHICERIVHSTKVERSTLVRATQAFAALDVTVPNNFLYFNRLNQKMSVAQGMMLDVGGRIEDILPEDFCKQHMLHDDYDDDLRACNSQHWHAWALSGKSRLSTLCVLESKSHWINTRSGLEQFLASVGAPPPVEYQYKSGTFSVDDWTFNASISRHLTSEEHRNGENWATLLDAILSVPSDGWKAHLFATIKEVASNGSSRNSRVEPIPANWIRVLASKPCLRDTYNTPRVPADLLLRTPDTEPLLSIDAFVSADLDTPENRPLLVMLGARDKASGTDRIVKRIQALAKCEKPPIHELAKWYEALDRAAARALPDEILALRRQFSSQALIWTGDEQWSLTGEVFCFADKDTMPDAATIHASVDKLPLWKRLGIADRPSLDLVINWLSQLAAGKLEPTTAKRVQACLNAFPHEIYNQLNAWLSLDQHWQSIDSFRYKHRDGSDLRVSDLFVAAKRNTADLRGIRPADLDENLFSQIDDLHTAVKFVVAEIIRSGPSISSPAWLNELGKTLERILLDDKEAQARIHQHAARFTTCLWQPVSSLQVTPYLDNAPVGQPQRPTVLWSSSTLFVHDVNIVEIVDDLANELQRPFESKTIADAIRVCIDRSRDFVTRYLGGKFSLETLEQGPQTLDTEVDSAPVEKDQGVMRADADSVLIENPHVIENDQTVVDLIRDESRTPLPSQSEESDPSIANEVEPGSGDDEFDSSPATSPQSGDTSPNSKQGTIESGGSADSETHPNNDRKSPELPKPSLLERYVTASGFRRIGDHYVSSDGRRMNRTPGRFTLEVLDRDGQVTNRIWMQSQSLISGLDVPAEVWEMIRNAPASTSIVFESPQGEPIELAGAALQDLLDRDLVRLFPAKYRLRQIAEFPQQLQSPENGARPEQHLASVKEKS